MTVYAGWDHNTERYLRGEGDDVYVRPLFSIIPDDSHENDPEHKSCSICQTEWQGARWVPHNGGAWVNSSSWVESGYNQNRYQGFYGELYEFGPPH